MHMSREIPTPATFLRGKQSAGSRSRYGHCAEPLPLIESQFPSHSTCRLFTILASTNLGVGDTIELKQFFTAHFSIILTPTDIFFYFLFLSGFPIKVCWSRTSSVSCHHPNHTWLTIASSRNKKKLPTHRSAKLKTQTKFVLITLPHMQCSGN